MVKRVGPCCHCGIETTPLWRVGPVEKLVLCNACGLRHRLRGNLDEYVPQHGMHPRMNPENSTQMGLNAGILNGTPVPRKKRSARRAPRKLTPIRKFHQLLLEAKKEEEVEEENPLLYYNSNWMMSENETRLGAVLLKSPQEESK